MEIGNSLKFLSNDRTVLFMQRFLNNTLVWCAEHFISIKEKAATIDYDQFQFICHQIYGVVSAFVSYLVDSLLVTPFGISLYYLKSYIKSFIIAGKK